MPVLLFTGPVGVGKSTVADAAGSLLRAAGIPHALADLAQIGHCFPAPGDDRWNERIVHRNLACMWANFRDGGARRLILSRVLEARSLLSRIEDAVPGADVTVVRLQAPRELIEERIRAREPGDPSWFLEAAANLVDSMERQRVEDHLVDNSKGPPREAAAEALRLVGWLPAATGPLTDRE